jgi:hypothetical protein
VKFWGAGLVAYDDEAVFSFTTALAQLLKNLVVWAGDRRYNNINFIFHIFRQVAQAMLRKLQITGKTLSK